MDYPKICGSQSELGIPFIHSDARLSLPLVGRDLLTKMGSQLHFHPDGSQVREPKGEPVQVLTLRLEDEYQLFEQK